MVNKRRHWLSWFLMAILAGAVPLASAQDLILKDRIGEHNARIRLSAPAPSYGPAPRGYIYGGSYPPPYPPYGYPWMAPVYPAPPAGDVVTDSAADLPGHVIILVDPVRAEVSVDGVRLMQREDLSYLVMLLDGAHEIQAQASGYQSQAKTVNVGSGVGLFVGIRLNRK